MKAVDPSFLKVQSEAKQPVEASKSPAFNQFLQNVPFPGIK